MKITILLLNRVKLVLAIPVLIADIVGTVACAMREFYVGVVVFFLLGFITLDYIRISWAEMKAGLWYELEDVETH